ncbi:MULTISPECIES: phosphatase PAP2 family protein [unclassified Bradyrhizobium]|uniref:phosphatase PAP2 family protein n=1 Tax=unclassified Bradyrhizobium TaxID=2631580 RepID=UPI001BA7EE96|nr:MULTISPECIES: phosphatase PAP2 family protein [unclassified Bradyrhizobium]MBR1225366.1 phosphatase PAP2 family protein [Bradyrhizobium sp. AUGA SZCCT0176]MBR1299998.1 phosphatase PAP2 family protein [Bradyrhizobium sp. AUGA SZCCT0042]
MVNSNAFTAWRLFQLNWIPIAAMGAVVLLGGALCGFTIKPLALAVTLGIVAALALIAYLHAFAKGDQADPKLIFPLGAISQLLLIATIMGPLTYVAAVTNWPLQDRALLAIDRAMGMDPEMIARYVNDREWLGALLVRSYTLIKIILLAIPLVLALTSRFVRLQVFVLAFSLTLIMTLVISTFTPAVGTYYGLNIDPAQFSSLDASMYQAQLRDILALRDGSLRHLELLKITGIVSFPSFHAASAVLYIWALWPVRYVGGAAVVLNILMMASTPVIGAHYMIDVFGGVALAVIGICLAKYLVNIVVPASSKAQAAPQVALVPALD